MGGRSSGEFAIRDAGLPSPWATAIAALLPPLLAFAGHSFFGPTVRPWSLFLAAVLTSAWFGGFRAGVAATLVSAGLVWWYLVPPEHVALKGQTKHIVAAAIFVGLGIGVSLIQRRFQQAKRDVAAALATTRRLNERLEQAVSDREIFAALIENSSDFIGIADANGKPIYINPAGRRMVQLPHDFDLASAHIEEFYPEDLRKFAANVILREALDEGHWEGETQFRNWTTGRPIPVWDAHFIVRDPATQRLLGMATITRDMSSIVRARTELENANERLHIVTRDLREAQRIGHIGSWFYDPITDTAEWSDETFRIHDRPADGSRPMIHGAKPLFTPESMAELDAANQKLLKDGSPYELEAELIRSDGSTAWVSVRGVPTRNHVGEIIGISGTTQDITELKKLQKLRQEWMSVVAHDLRQPIGVIKMAAELLPDLHDGAVSKQELDVTRRIRSASLELSRMVDDLLDVSRLEAHRLTLDRTWVDPRAIVDEAVARLAYITTGIHLKVSSDSDLPAVYADPGRVGQVLGNLISNAIKYGDRTSDVAIQLKREGDVVRVSVTNHGKGISPEELPKLFQRFARRREDRSSGVAGLGLGLYIAKGLVDAHSGRLWGESVPGDTTTFSFTLPTRTARFAHAA